MPTKIKIYWINPFPVCAILILLLTNCGAAHAATTDRAARTLRANERVSIYGYKCALAIRSSSTSRVIVKCSGPSSHFQRPAAGHPYLKARQSATIKSNSCVLETLSSSARLVKLQCLTAPSLTVPTPTPTPTASANISIGPPALALAVNNPALNPNLTGNSRRFTVSNGGATTARSISFSVSPALPSGTTISSTCSNIPPSGGCTLTITPGLNPSAMPGDINPAPIVVTINGINTNTLTPSVQVLTYGSVYQGGYIFAVDDTTASDNSIGGKVLTLTDQSSGIVWDPGCPGVCTPSIAANDNFDGSTNSSAINAAMSLSYAANTYAAGVCSETINGYSDWYLPAICEMGYGGDMTSPCGDVSSPTLQNIQSSLVDLAAVPINYIYWSSTQTSTIDPLIYADLNIFGSGGNQPGDFKEISYSVRCVRRLTP